MTNQPNQTKGPPPLARHVALKRALDLLPRDDINALARYYLPTLQREPHNMRRADITKRLVWAVERLGRQEMRHEIANYLSKEITKGVAKKAVRR